VVPKLCALVQIRYRADGSESRPYLFRGVFDLKIRLGPDGSESRPYLYFGRVGA
jgi:hypothetical protein